MNAGTQVVFQVIDLNGVKVTSDPVTVQVRLLLFYAFVLECLYYAATADFRYFVVCDAAV